MIIGVYHSIVIELAFPRNTGTQGERNSKETFFFLSLRLEVIVEILYPHHF
jgi:hypothetical protein